MNQRPKPICERLTFRQLANASEPGRVERSGRVRGPALDVEAARDSQYHHFNFRAYPSTTGMRHQGFVRFFRPSSLYTNARLDTLQCEVDCTCPDYRYRWAWSNKQRGAGTVGARSLNKAINRAPRITNPGNKVGLCKHILRVRDFVIDQMYRANGTANDRLDQVVASHRRTLLPGAGDQRGRANQDPYVNQVRRSRRGTAAPRTEGAVVSDVSHAANTFKKIFEDHAAEEGDRLDQVLDLVTDISQKIDALVPAGASAGDLGDDEGFDLPKGAAPIDLSTGLTQEEPSDDTPGRAAGEADDPAGPEVPDVGVPDPDGDDLDLEGDDLDLEGDGEADDDEAGFKGDDEDDEPRA